MAAFCRNCRRSLRDKAQKQEQSRDEIDRLGILCLASVLRLGFAADRLRWCCTRLRKDMTCITMSKGLYKSWEGNLRLLNCRFIK